MHRRTFLVGAAGVALSGDLMLRRLLMAAGGGGSFSGGDMAFHGVRAFHSTSQTLTSGAHTIVALDSTDYDSDAYHDDVTNNHRLTVPTGLAGYYLIFGAASIFGNVTGQRLAVVCINEPSALSGSTEILVPVAEATPGLANTHLVLSTVRYLADGDYIDLRIYQNSGGNLSLDVGSNPGDYVPSFGMVRLGF